MAGRLRAFSAVRIACQALAILVAGLVAQPAVAQQFSGLARLDAAASEVRDISAGLEVELYLSQVVPWRVFLLDDPRRLVLDFREVDWRGADPEMIAGTRATGLRTGALRPGWSRMILDLAEPMRVDEAGMQVSETDGTARLLVRLTRTDTEGFAAAAGAPHDPDWDFLMAADPGQGADPAPEDDLVVVIDPGHGGIDPGAQHGGVTEANLMLALGYELANAVERMPGVTPFLTREADIFVPLQERLTLARAVGADLFISLHADALEGLQATGASVYTLAEEATDEATQRIAERHDRGDIVAGLDLSGQDDEVAKILMDLARLETGPAGDRFAEALVVALDESGAPLTSRPRRSELLAVLTSADFPAVLLEVGFLSHDGDRARLSSREGRLPIVEGVVLAIDRWAIEEAALAPLKRQ
jgi:N-acetylmuramoyl-L-alanine amidase